MATKTKEIAPLVKGKKSPNTSNTKSLVNTNASNLVASNRKNIYLKSKVSSSSDKTQGTKTTPSTSPNIHHKQTLTHSTSMDKPPSSLDNTRVKKNHPTSSNDLNIVNNKPNVARGSSSDNRSSQPSNLDNAQGKKLASPSRVPPSIHNKQTLAPRRLSIDNKSPQSSSSLDHNTQGKKIDLSISDSNSPNKQTLAQRRLSFDHKLPPSSFRDNSPQGKKIVPKNDPNIHSKQTPTRGRLSIDHKPPLSSPVLKNRTSPNPKDRLLKPPLSSSSKNSTSQIPLLNKLSKAPHTSSSSKDAVIGKQDGVGLNAKEVNMNKTIITKKEDSPTGLTSNVTDNIVETVDPHHDDGEELEQEEIQELVIEEDHEELSEIVNIDEYLKAAESSSSLYIVENDHQLQEVMTMEQVPDQEQLLIDETSIIIKEVEEIKNLETSNLDLEEIEKQESDVVMTIAPPNENQEEKKEGEESKVLLKALDDCHQQEKKEEEKIIDQEKKEESEGRNNKGKEENINNKTSNTMTFAKAYLHLVKGNDVNNNNNKNNNKKESVVSNNVIEETASKLREQRKNRVKALASAFETVISLQDSK